MTFAMNGPVMPQPKQPNLLHATPHLSLVERDDWFYVTRPNAHGVVMIVAITDDDKIILIEQYRPPVASSVIELPAGLAGDERRLNDEPLADAARRELLEETGYAAGSMTELATGTTSPGLCDEVITVFLATDLEKVEAGGGSGNERIEVRAIPLDEVDTWLEGRQREGALVDLKVYAGLALAGRRR